MAFFRSVPIAEAVFSRDRLPAGLARHAHDSITLTWQERAKSRARWTTAGGVEFGTMLPPGTVLKDGDCLALENPPLVIVVREEPEPVLVATPGSPEQAALWAYQIGNSHQPLMLEAGALICLDVKGMDEVLAFHAIPFERAVRPFTPVSVGPGHHG